MKIEIEDKDRLRAEIIDAIVDRLLYGDDGDGKLAQQVEKRIDEVVREQCQKAAMAIAVDQLTPRISALLDENAWTVYTGSYGDTKKTLRLVDLLRTFLEPPNYNSRDHFVTKIVDDRVKEAFTKEFEPQIKAAGKALRDRLDTILGEKVSLAVREAVGLR